MSKSITGKTQLNIGTLNLKDIAVETIEATNSINGNYLTANRGIATDSNKKLVSTTATDTEINYLSGVSSAIQTQLNAKQATIADGDLSIAKTSGLQSALDAKQATISAGTNLSFNGTTLNAANQVPNITASRVAVSDTNGDLTASSITTTELDFLDGVSSGIQSQLNAKQATITAGTNLSFNGTTLNATADGLPLPAGVIGGTQPCLLLYNQTGDTMTQQQNIEVSNSGIKLVGASNGLACGGASLNGVNVETTGACNAVGGFNATNGGITVSGAVDCASVVATGNIKCSGTFLNSSNQNILSGIPNISTRIDNFGVTGTQNSGKNWNIRISGGRTGVNNWSGAKASNEFNGSLALGGDFDGATIGLKVVYDIQQRFGYFESDDRVKHFERETTNCLDKIMVLTPKTYIKSTELYDYDFVLAEDGSNKKEGDNLGVECGFIAQEVLASAEEHQYDELGFSVKGGDYTDESGNTIADKYIVNYNNLFCVAVGAIKELKAEVDTLKERIAVLEG